MEIMFTHTVTSVYSLLTPLDASPFQTGDPSYEQLPGLMLCHRSPDIIEIGTITSAAMLNRYPATGVVDGGTRS